MPVLKIVTKFGRPYVVSSTGAAALPQPQPQPPPPELQNWWRTQLEPFSFSIFFRFFVLDCSLSTIFPSLFAS